MCGYATIGLLRVRVNLHTAPLWSASDHNSLSRYTEAKCVDRRGGQCNTQLIRCLGEVWVWSEQRETD